MAHTSLREHLAARRRHGLTYRALAEEFGLAPSTAHCIVNGRGAPLVQRLNDEIEPHAETQLPDAED